MGKGQKGIGDREELMLTVASGGVGGGGVRWGGIGGVVRRGGSALVVLEPVPVP